MKQPVWIIRQDGTIEQTLATVVCEGPEGNYVAIDGLPVVLGPGDQITTTITIALD